ncbi:hypothetical protein LP417_11265 [Polaromonas sp. P1-6]|nr:hypothetical protein LP417_11265 [Polaromonas sp. P1-6]
MHKRFFRLRRLHSVFAARPVLQRATVHRFSGFPRVAASLVVLFASTGAFAATCTELEASLAVIGNKAYADQHVNVAYCLSLYPSGYVCGSDVQFHIESQEVDGSQQRRNAYRYVGPPSTGSVVSLWFTPWESCAAASAEPVPEPESGIPTQDGMCMGNPRSSQLQARKF